MTTESPDLTQLLRRMKDGDVTARAQLVAIVYPQLKQMAARRMRMERRDHTLQPTALVNEFFLRLVGAGEVDWQDRVHFFAVAAEFMRRILVDAARKRRSMKRGGKVQIVELHDSLLGPNEQPDVILEVDRLLDRLEALDRRQAKVVEMRYFVGLTEEEIGEVLGISERTVKRDWQMARAWMRKEMSQR